MITSFEMKVTALTLSEGGTGTLRESHAVIASLSGAGVSFDIEPETTLELGQRVRVSIESLPAAARRSIVDSVAASVSRRVAASRDKVLKRRE